MNLQNSPGFALDLTPMQSWQMSRFSMGLPRNVSCHLTSQHPRAQGVVPRPYYQLGRQCQHASWAPSLWAFGIEACGLGPSSP